MPNDVFRPRLPLDPFGPQPWRVALPSAQSSSSRPQEVILMLGAPSPADLAPLTTSPLLTNALLIIATHTPPPVLRPTSSSSGPSIIVLRLPEPLHIHDSGAIRLVNLMDRASRVAHSWRTALLPQARIQQLAELFPGGEFSISEEPELAVVPLQQQRNQLQAHPLSRSSTGDREEGSDDDSASTISSTASTASSRFSSRSSFKRAKANSKNATSQAQFSALINFLPPGLPDKSMLKNAVLVTTLTTPFLAAPGSNSPYGEPTDKKRNRQSTFSSLSFTSLIGSQADPASISPASSPNRSRSRFSTIFSNPPTSYDQSKSSPPSLRGSPSVESFVTHKARGNVKRPHLIHVLPYSASMSAGVLPLPPSHPLVKEKRRSRTYDASSSSLNPNAAAGLSRGTTIAVPSKGKERVYEPFGPTTKSKLVQSIEQFLLQYAYPPTASSTSSLPLVPGVPGISALASGSALGSSPLSKPSPQERRRSFFANNSAGSPPAININAVPGSAANSNAQAIVPYVLAAGVLGFSPVSTPNLAPSQRPPCIGELLLQRLMDNIAGGRGAGGDEDVLSFGANVAPVDWPRAWIGRGDEVEIVTSPGINDGAESLAGSSPIPRGRQPFPASGLPVPAPPLSVVNSESLESSGSSGASPIAMVNSTAGLLGSGSGSVIRPNSLSSGASTPESPEMEVQPIPKRRSQLPFGGMAIPRQPSAELKMISSSLPSSFAPHPPPEKPAPLPTHGNRTGKENLEKQKQDFLLPTPPDSSSSASSSTRSASSSSGEHADDEVETSARIIVRTDIPHQGVEDPATPIASRYTRPLAIPVKTTAIGLPTPGSSRESSRARSDFTHGYPVDTQKAQAGAGGSNQGREKKKQGLKGKLTSLFSGKGRKQVTAT